MNITNIKNLRSWIPEIYLVLSVIYYWYMTGTLLNPFAISLLTILAILIWLKKRVLGVTIAIIFLVLNLYMVLALISEFREFPTVNSSALTLLFVGALYLGLNIFLSVRMLAKWTSDIPGNTASN